MKEELVKRREPRRFLFYTFVLWLLISCGGGGGSSGGGGTADICNCSPADPVDFRAAEKHVPLPNITPQEITVADMLTWPQQPVPVDGTPRTGRELQLFHIAHAFLRSAELFAGDCDISMEISDATDTNVPRVIVETPIDSEYCSARRDLQSQLAAHGFTLSPQSGELPTPLAIDVVGLAFEDFPHAARGSALVGTLWELHPAIVTVSP